MALNKILNFVQAGVIIVLAILLFQSGCNKQEKDFNKDLEKLRVQIYEKDKTIDSLNNEISYLTYKLDSLSALKQKEVVRYHYVKESGLKRLKIDTLRDTVYQEVDLDNPKLQIVQETSYFQDSTYKLTSAIFYKGKIDRTHYMFETLKYPVNFIPRKEYVTKEILIKEKVQSKLPRIYANVNVQTRDYFIPNQINLGLSVQDNKNRIYSAAVNPLETKQIQIQYQHPIIYSKR